MTRSSSGRRRMEIVIRMAGISPPILDPFAGGGIIPLEAQRLGLDAHASDLNPVAVLINKALIEIPSRWAGRPPVFPGCCGPATNLAARNGPVGGCSSLRRVDARPKRRKKLVTCIRACELPNGGPGTVIAWLWARTITCPSPACGADIPLVSSWWLSKKKEPNSVDSTDRVGRPRLIRSSDGPGWSA